MKPNSASLVQFQPTTVRLLVAITLLSACFAFSFAQKAFGVIPAPDGGYPNGNTAEGSSALLNLTDGESNTAIGELSLANTTTGSNNTATGDDTLLHNITGSYNTANGSQALFHNIAGDYNTANWYVIAL